MPLKLEPYDPQAEMKARAARAVAAFTKEYAALKDPGVNLGADTNDRLKANSKRWRGAVGYDRNRNRRSSK